MKCRNKLFLKMLSPSDDGVVQSSNSSWHQATRGDVTRLWSKKFRTRRFLYTRVSQPAFRRTIGFCEMSLRVPREIVIEKNKHRFFNLLAKINRSTKKYNSLLKRALTIIIGLLYLQFIDHDNVPWPVDIIIFMQRFPETWKLFQGFLQGKKIEKGCFIL
jgi:hypothetical protein